MYTSLIDYTFFDDQEQLEVSNNKSLFSNKYASAGLYFCNSKMNPGVACATKAESIKYFKEHNLTIWVYSLEHFINFYDFNKPFGMRP